ncbi:hypothetical protein [Cohnella sp.]|uniref:hypothetical protein n=1 Tax=Cohnella sp. TaxID=1883426 RepID=UPI0035695A9B
MGLLYKIYQSIQEQDENTVELMDSLDEKDGDKSSEHPKSLIELLTRPIGRRLPESKTD